ncbi:MAG: oligosaccharide flippase family protein [Bacteroidetes bacterium]|nr:oligosaccharide flippase family protein [Bacteroidota bacterium]
MTLKQRISTLFADSDFRAPVLKLVSGQGVALVIGYVASLVLMRLYADEYWGVVDYIVSWTTILIPVVSLRFEDALMLPEDKRQSAHAYLLAVAVTALSCLLLLVILSFSDIVVQFFDEKDIGKWSLFIPLALVFHRFSKITELWLSRHDDFTHISAGQIVQVGAMTGVRTAAGLVAPGTGGLIWGFIVGYALSLATYSKRLIHTLRIALDGRPTLREMRIVANRYRRFPMFTMPAALLSALIMRLPVLILPEFLDWGTMGQFSRGFNILFVPLSLLAASVAQVFFVRAVKTNREGTLATFSSNVHSKLVMMSIFPTAILMIAGGDIFQVLFGLEWRASGEYLLYMAPWIMLSIVSSPMTRLFDVLERQKLEFTVAVVMSVIMVSVLFLAGRTQDASQIIMYLGISGSLVRLGQILLMLKLSGSSFSNTFKPYFKYMGIVFPSMLLSWYVSTLGVPAYTFLTAILGGIGFAAYIIKTERLLSPKA